MSPTDETPPGLVFVVDDDEDQRTLFGHWLRKAGFETRLFPDGISCLDALSEERPDAICLDLLMPVLSGLETLERIRQQQTLLPIIVLTADETAASAVQAMKLGAFDYLVKPLREVKLTTTVRNAVGYGRLTLRVNQLEREAVERKHTGIVGTSRPMARVFHQIAKLSVNDVTVMIHGESGTGKELVARAIHDSSDRRARPFVAVNLTAIPENLVESELFGHEKGSFTGATVRRIGKLEEANTGTLFLDEIGELSLAVQAKLLRVLQERSFQRVGGTFEMDSNFRLLTATHRNLAADVKSGRFREDLYFRLAVFDLELPPLRERRDDILPLAMSFIRDYRETVASHVTGVSMMALEILLQYNWPGNVRELQNVIQRAMVIAEHEELQPEDLPGRIREEWSVAEPEQRRPKAVPGLAPRHTMEEASKLLLQAAIEKNEGNAAAVMRELKVGRTRFYRMLKQFHLVEAIDQARRTGKALRPGDPQ